VLRQVSAYAGIVVEGCFTHFATADDADLGPARKQLETFLAVLRGVVGRGLPIGLRHAANSAAFLALPEAHFDIVRAGIAVYGVLPVEVGDEVEIWGEKVPVEEVAATAQTIAYEVLTHVGRRVPRVFVQDGQVVGVRTLLAEGGRGGRRCGWRFRVSGGPTARRRRCGSSGRWRTCRARASATR